MPPDTVTWLGIGFVVSWVIIGAYLVRLAHAQREVSRRLDELASSRGTRAGGEPSATGQTPPPGPLA